jgi:hypothetical protein
MGYSSRAQVKMKKDIEIPESELDFVKDPSQIERLTMTFQNLIYQETIREIAAEKFKKKAKNEER